VSADIGSVALRLRSRSGRLAAERVAREFRGSLRDAFDEALGPYVSSKDVAMVSRLRVSLSVPLERTGGRELARRIARACVEAIAHGGERLITRPFEADDGSAERILQALREDGAVRIDGASEAASWLVALARDELTALRHVSPYADLASRPSGAAFLEVCARSEAPRAIVAALGRMWARILALRCSPAEATALLRILDDGSQPDTSTWRILLSSAAGEERPIAPRAGAGGPRRADAIATMQYAYRRDPTFAVRMLAAALDGLFDRCTGIVAGARAIISSATTSKSERFAVTERLAPSSESASSLGDVPSTSAPTGDGSRAGDVTEVAAEALGSTDMTANAFDSAGTTAQSVGSVDKTAQAVGGTGVSAGNLAETGGSVLRSNCTGFWLLLPHLERCRAPTDEPVARAVAFAMAERLCGKSAADDPAIAAFMNGERSDELLERVPAGERIDRLAVRVVRSFAQSLTHFERARCGYVLQAFLRGPGEVRRTSNGWRATLPRSPLRIVLEHALWLGKVETAWSEPVLEIVREL
jgi:hypothetical protein